MSATTRVSQIIMLTATAMLATRSSTATDWRGTLQASADAAYVTNPRMIPGADSTSDEMGVLTLDGNAVAETERTDFTITPRVQLARYNHETDLNTDNGSLTVDFQQKLERGKWSVAGVAAADSTVTSELGTTGITYVNRRHSMGSLDLGYQFFSTERLSWSANVSGQVTRYRDAELLGLVDYDYGSVQFGPSWGFSELLTGSLSLQASRLNPDAGAIQNDYGVSAQLRRQFSERYSWRLSVGWTRVDYSSTPVTPTASSNTVAYDVGATYTGERLSCDLSAKRAVLPIGIGLLAPQTVAALAATLNTSEFSTLTASINGIRTESVYVAEILVYTGATWAQAALEWRYHFTQHWALSVAYQQARARALDVQDWANGKQAKLGVIWDSGRL